MVKRIKTVYRIIQIITTIKTFIPPSPAPKPATRASDEVKITTLFSDLTFSHVLFLISKTLLTAETLSNKKQPTCANAGTEKLAVISPAIIEKAKTAMLMALAVIFVLLSRKLKLNECMPVLNAMANSIAAKKVMRASSIP